MPRTLPIVAAFSLLTGPAMAENVLDKIKHGAESVGQAVEKGVNAVDESITSTEELLTNEATVEETRAKLDVMADEVLARLLAEDPDAQVLFDQSQGYAVFDSRKVTVFPVSAGLGRGVAISKETGQHTYMNMGTGGVGAALGIGGFETQYVVMFETQADLDGFIEHGYDATAETAAMHGEDKEAETLRFTDGRSFFVLGKTGWRVSAEALGAKYWKSPELN